MEEGTSSKTQGVRVRPGTHRDPSIQRQKGIGRNHLELMEKACNRGFCLEAFVLSVMQEEMVSGKNKEGALVNQSVLYRATQGNIQEE